MDGKKLSSNLLALIVSVLTSVGICVGYLILYEVQFDAKIAVYMIAITIMTWLCATLGYDKVIQTLKQLGVVEK